MHPKPHAFKGATWMALATVLLLGACANPPAGPTQTDGTYCFNPGRSNSKSKTCTPVAVPSEQAQAQARQFAPVPGAAALYVVRNRLDDAHNRVPVSVDGRAPVITVPGSVLRVLLAPGQHRVSLDWDGKRVDLDVKASADQVLFAEIEGSSWSSGSHYQWYAPDAERSRKRAGSARLIADLDLRR